MSKYRGLGQSPLSPNELSARPPWPTLPLVHESCSWTIAVVLHYRKMTMERTEPISTIWRMFIFLANAKTTAIPNKTLLGSQGTATANRIVKEKRRPTNGARNPRGVPEKYFALFRRSKKGVAATRTTKDGVKIAAVATRAPGNPLTR